MAHAGLMTDTVGMELLEREPSLAGPARVAATIRRLGRAGLPITSVPVRSVPYTAKVFGRWCDHRRSGGRRAPASGRLIYRGPGTGPGCPDVVRVNDGRSNASLRSSRWTRVPGRRHDGARGTSRGCRRPDHAAVAAGASGSRRALAWPHGRGRAGGRRPVRVLLAPVADPADQFGRRGERAAGVGHAARQPAAARLAALGRLLLHHRAAAVHGDRGDTRPRPRGGQPRRGDDLHAAGAAGGPAREG